MAGSQPFRDLGASKLTLSRSEDKQMRNMIVLTKPDERMLKLWGVRFVVADFEPGFGTPSGTLPISGRQALRLLELEDFNRGQYSPTKVIKAKDFRSALAFMRDLSFDGSLEVVTDADLPGDLRAAEDVELTVEKYGLSIRASSLGQSILVLQPLLERPREWRSGSLPRQHHAAWRELQGKAGCLPRIPLRADIGGALSARGLARYGAFRSPRRALVSSLLVLRFRHRRET
jgi:hypothetical protein